MDGYLVWVTKVLSMHQTTTSFFQDDREGYKFATKEAPQMKGIFRMIEALVG